MRLLESTVSFAHSRPRTALLTTFCLLSLTSLSQTKQDSKVDVGGYKLHIVQSGSGSPAVVFESGMGEDVNTWNDVQPQVASFAHTVTYERAGIGSSGPSPNAITIEQMSKDLHTLLHAAKIQPPYVLVGHSLGGAIVQIFAHAYPSEVAGVVLVDPEDGRLLEELQSRMGAQDWAARQRALDEAIPNMPAAAKAELEATNKSGPALAAALPLPRVPVVLLTGTLKNPQFPGNPLEQDLKLELHNDLLARIPDSKHVLAPNSRHYIQNDAPDLVIRAIREVMQGQR